MFCCVLLWFCLWKLDDSCIYCKNGLMSDNRLLMTWAAALLVASVGLGWYGKSRAFTELPSFPAGTAAPVFTVLPASPTVVEDSIGMQVSSDSAVRQVK